MNESKLLKYLPCEGKTGILDVVLDQPGGASCQNIMAFYESRLSSRLEESDFEDLYYYIACLIRQGLLENSYRVCERLLSKNVLGTLWYKVVSEYLNQNGGVGYARKLCNAGVIPRMTLETSLSRFLAPSDKDLGHYAYLAGSDLLWWGVGRIIKGKENYSNEGKMHLLLYSLVEEGRCHGLMTRFFSPSEEDRRFTIKYETPGLEFFEIGYYAGNKYVVYFYA